MKAVNRWLPLAGAALLVWSACSKQAEVQKQASELEKAFPASTAAAPGQAESLAAEQPSSAEANAYVKAALQAVRSNDFAGGVVMLDSVARKPGLTAEQLMAVQQARNAFVTQLTTRAAQGDENAKAALAAIEKTRSQ